MFGKEKRAKKAAQAQAAVGYHRFQEDRQQYFARNAQQQKIVDNFFVVRNEVRSHSVFWMFPVGLALIAIGVALAIILLISGKAFALSLIGVGIALLGVGFIVMWNKLKGKSVAPAEILSQWEYEKAVNIVKEYMNIGQMSVAALGLSEETVKNAVPVVFSDSVLNDTAFYAYYPETKQLYSSAQEVTYLYFASDRLFAYSICFDMCCNDTRQITSEIFYKDICDISVEKISEVRILNGIKSECNLCEVSVVTAFSSFMFNASNTEENRTALEQMRKQFAEKRR